MYHLDSATVGDSIENIVKREELYGKFSVNYAHFCAIITVASKDNPPKTHTGKFNTNDTINTFLESPKVLLEHFNEPY